MLPGSGSLATAQTLARSPSRWMCPTLSTRFTEPLSCGLCASIFRPFLHGSTAVIATRAPCSPVLVTLLCSPSPALEVFSKVTPSVRCSLLWLFTLPLLRPAPPRRPCVCSFFLDDGFCAGSSAAVRGFLSALTEGFRRIGLTVNLEKTEVIPACPLALSFCHADFQECSLEWHLQFQAFGCSDWVRRLV